MAIVVVIVTIPVAIGTPTMSIFIPPTTAVIPAVRTSFGEFVAPVFGLRTVVAMVFDGFVKPVVDLGDALLALIIGPQRSSAEQAQGSAKRERR